jgi:hypothetical protein
MKMETTITTHEITTININIEDKINIRVQSLGRFYTELEEAKTLYFSWLVCSNLDYDEVNVKSEVFSIRDLAIRLDLYWDYLNKESKEQFNNFLINEYEKHGVRINEFGMGK